MSRSSHRPINPVYYIEDCWISSVQCMLLFSNDPQTSFKLDLQIRQQALRASCPSVFTVSGVFFFFLCMNTNLNQATIFHTNYLSNFSKQVRHGQNTRVIQLWLKMFRAVLH